MWKDENKTKKRPGWAHFLFLKKCFIALSLLLKRERENEINVNCLTWITFPFCFHRCRDRQIEGSYPREEEISGPFSIRSCRFFFHDSIFYFKHEPVTVYWRLPTADENINFDRKTWSRRTQEILERYRFRQSKPLQLVKIEIELECCWNFFCVWHHLLMADCDLKKENWSSG